MSLISAETSPQIDLEDYDYKKFILIRNARQNNLKGIDLAIPQGKLVVITGVSGSGKSSLAFDTLYAEGQRRYVESLSAYVRQFLGKINKPAVDYIKGLSPAVAIKQKVNTTNPRSTVGTATEIYDYVRLLYARIGRTFSPVTGKEVHRHTVGNVVAFCESLEVGTRYQVLCPLFKPAERIWPAELAVMSQKGFTRLEVAGKQARIEDLQRLLEGGDLSDGTIPQELIALRGKLTKELDKALLLVDRLQATKDDDDNRARTADSIQTAFYEGHGTCIIETFTEDGKPSRFTYSDKFELDGITFEPPSVNLFTFNNPYGACKTCEGFGMMIGIDEDKVVPDKTRSVYDEGVVAWRGEKMSEWRDEFIKNAVKLYNFPIHRPYSGLNEEERDLLWHGGKGVDGIFKFFEYIESKVYKLQYRILLARYKGRSRCLTCGGARLRKEARYVKVSGKAITELVDMSLADLQNWFEDVELDETESKTAKRILTEITNRLDFINDVGLGYLNLNRAARTLSGGESQRIQIVTSLGSTLTGALYILDEPSIGLHSRDTDRLIKVLRRLKSLGNTVIVVEHDEEIIRQADYIIDIGPGAGNHGGELVYAGPFEEMMEDGSTLTARYLRGLDEVHLPKVRRAPTGWVALSHLSKHNIQDLSLRLPLGVMTVVTGVSGSGKSTLMYDLVYPLLRPPRDASAAKGHLAGDFNRIKGVEYIDQNPIGRSSRSIPVTYVKAFDGIRNLFAMQPLAKQRGLGPAYFSFNVEGGRCEVCQGDGYLHIEMQFMADVVIDCDNCHGARYKADALEVTYKGESIARVLNMNVDAAIEFFKDEVTIAEALKPLSMVGLGYLALGQPSTELSGGEAQRIKLATYLAKGAAQDPILFFFDEPTTGLHFNDVAVLLSAFYKLLDRGHTLIVVEHNIDVIKCADYLIEMGPEGGDAGGKLVYQGAPEGLLNVAQSATAQYLAPKLGIPLLKSESLS